MRDTVIPQETIDQILASAQRMHAMLPDLREIEAQAQQVIAAYRNNLPDVTEVAAHALRAHEVLSEALPSASEIQRMIDAAIASIEVPNVSLSPMYADTLLAPPVASMPEYTSALSEQLYRIESKLNRLLPPDDPMDLN